MLKLFTLIYHNKWGVERYPFRAEEPPEGEEAVIRLAERLVPGFDLEALGDPPDPEVGSLSVECTDRWCWSDGGPADQWPPAGSRGLRGWWMDPPEIQPAVYTKRTSPPTPTPEVPEEDPYDPEEAPGLYEDQVRALDQIEDGGWKECLYGWYAQNESLEWSMDFYTGELVLMEGTYRQSCEWDKEAPLTLLVQIAKAMRKARDTFVVNSQPQPKAAGDYTRA